MNLKKPTFCLFFFYYKHSHPLSFRAYWRKFLFVIYSFFTFIFIPFFRSHEIFTKRTLKKKHFNNSAVEMFGCNFFYSQFIDIFLLIRLFWSDVFNILIEFTNGVHKNISIFCTVIIEDKKTPTLECWK